MTSLISISGGRCSVRDSSRRLLPFAKTRRRNLKMAVGSWELASWHLCALALNSPPFPSAAGQIPVPLAQNQGSTSGDIAARWSLPLFCRSRGDETHFNFGRQMFSQRLLTSSPTIAPSPGRSEDGTKCRTGPSYLIKTSPGKSCRPRSVYGVFTPYTDRSRQMIMIRIKVCS